MSILAGPTVQFGLDLQHDSCEEPRAFTPGRNRILK
jgi:hypothetical protein